MIVAPSGAVFKPEECGVDGDGNGWCSGESVPAEWFMKEEEPPSPPKKPAKLKSAKKSKKKDDGGGRIMAVKQLKKKGGSAKKQPLNTWTKPKGESGKDPPAEPGPGGATAKPIKGGADPWIAIVILVLAIPIGYFLWKRYEAEKAKAELEPEDKAKKSGKRRKKVN